MSPPFGTLNFSAIVPGSIENCLSLGLCIPSRGCVTWKFGEEGGCGVAGGGGWESMGDSSMSLILAEFAMAGGTLTIEGVCRYLRIRDNAFKDPGEMFSF